MELVTGEWIKGQRMEYGTLTLTEEGVGDRGWSMGKKTE